MADTHLTTTFTNKEVTLKATLKSANVQIVAQAFTVPPNFLAYMDNTMESVEADRVAVEESRDLVIQLEEQAQVSADTATTAATEASQSEDLAQTHAVNAGTSADESAASAAEALASEQTAKDWAEKGEDIAVETGMFSAKHHALKAGDASTAAEDSAAAALQSEANAEDSATAAYDSEQAAKASETAAGTSETNAATSETNSKASEDAAAVSAQSAADSATEAGTYVGDHEAAEDPHIQYVLKDGAVDSVDGRTGAVDLSDRYERKRQHNLTATTNPGVTDDETAGYEPLSRWINTDSDEIWLCIDATEGAADWQQATLTLDELGSAAVADVGTGSTQLPRNEDLGSASLAETTDFEPAGTVAEHEAKDDPHSQYTTEPEVEAIAVSKAIAFAIALG